MRPIFQLIKQPPSNAILFSHLLSMLNKLLSLSNRLLMLDKLSVIMHSATR